MTGQTAALALFDLNGFKVYNDTFGHFAGDSPLARLADNLTAWRGARPSIAWAETSSAFALKAPNASKL